MAGMTPIRSFPPLASAHSHTLVLGSMPGVASLNAQQYYAHPRNQFWPIMARLLGFDARAPYPERCAALLATGIAIWDVLQSCVREGSLDSDIARNSEVPNDFATLFARHPRIRRVCFNGAKAETLFMRHVGRTLQRDTQLAFVSLPSTSPAHASMNPVEKLQRWEQVLNLGPAGKTAQ